MIIDGPDSVTRAVLSEIERAPDARVREILSALVRHLHGFIREVRLTEDEFREACA
jgi:catechol 1,2-dioxygenase